MKTLYLVNTGYTKQPTIPYNEWLKHSDFMDKLSTWQIASKANALSAVDSYDVIAVRCEQLQGYCMAVDVHTVQDSTGAEIERLGNSLQRVQDKHKAKVALYDSLLQHLLNKQIRVSY